MRGYYPKYRERSGGGIIFVLFLVGVFLTVCLYFVKTRAQTAKSEAVRLERLVNAERAAVKILQAELAHLESPARLSQLAETELGLVPITIERVKSLEDVVQDFPLRAVDQDVQP